MEGHLRAKKSPRLTGLLTLIGEDWSLPGKKTKKPLLKEPNTKVGNDINRSSTLLHVSYVRVNDGKIGE